MSKYLPHGSEFPPVNSNMAVQADAFHQVKKKASQKVCITVLILIEMEKILIQFVFYIFIGGKLTTLFVGT